MKNESIRTVTSGGSIVYRANDGSYHREDGPAIETPEGHLEYWVYGKLHREDGPAIFSGNNPKNNNYKTWFYKGVKIPCSSQEEFERLIKLRVFL
jgi:hypothetical protein